MKSSKGKGFLGLLAILFSIGLFGYFGYDTMDDIKLGLDLAAAAVEPCETVPAFVFGIDIAQLLCGSGI